MVVRNYQELHRGVILKYYWQVMRQHLLPFLVVVCATIISSIMDVYVPYQYLKLWNLLSLNNFEVVSAAKSLIILVFLLNLFRWAVRRTSSFCLAYFEATVIAGLRNQAFAYMVGHSHAFFADNFSGSLTQRVNKYAKSFEKITDRMVADGIPILVRSVGTVVVVYSLFPKYAYILGLFCVVFLIISFVYIRYKLKYDIIASEADSRTTGALADAIGNHTSVQLFTGHEHEKNRFSNVVEDQRNKTVFNWYLWEGINAINSFLSYCVEFIIFWLVLSDWRLGLITLPTIVLIQNYLGRLIESLWNFGSIVRTYYESFADAEEMAMILNTPYEIKDSLMYTLKDVKGDVVFDHVTYVYENNNTNVLNDFSITIPAGQKVALIGSSGAGKTTFVRLLMRFFNITSGNITIDGIDISKVTQENLRDNIAFVPQDPVLFHRTLMDNIRYGRRDATDEDVKKAAHLAHCDDFIDKLPQGYETYVGERGVKLSGGERQRVAIARALLKNAPILILDEATSALDSHSESLIQDALKYLMKNKTTIVIAHRLSTIREMDRIVVLDNGRVVEDGTHDDLLDRKTGLYKKLWDLQAGGFKNTI